MARPTPEQLQQMTDEDLAGLSQDITAEQHRRDELVRAPAIVDMIIQRFVDAGGDTTKIKNPNSYIKGPKK
jgi:hypothetical protein